MAKRKPTLVDTNVLVVANNGSPQASEPLLDACIEALLDIATNGGLVMDEDGRIFEEYLQQPGLSLAGQPFTGSMFLKWVHDNQWNPALCERRSIRCLSEPEQVFDEFPTHPELEEFDVSDRKFVAVANASSRKAMILQAVDFKWWGWQKALEECGIEVCFLDEAAAEEGYRKHCHG